MDRRGFLRSGSSLSLPLMLGGLNISVLANPAFDFLSQDASDRILVLIQQNGGNDGLSMVIPRDQYSNLSVHRPELLIPENQVLDITDSLGLHPNMAGLQSLFKEEIVSVVQNVGYQNQNRSHFRSTDIWDTGSRAEEVLTSGWIGRYLDTIHNGYPDGYPNEQHPHPIAIALGPSVSETCQGIAGNYSLAINDPSSLASIPGVDGSELPDTPYGSELTFLRQVVEQTNIYSQVLKDVVEKGTNKSDLYPERGNNPLSDQLKTIAQLISGGLQTRIYIANLNGFDTHANQVEMNSSTSGNHAQLLSNLSEALLAFVDDLRQQGLQERVLAVTRSEFGRQIAGNGSYGTDHGDAAPLLLVGSCINSSVVGDNPTIHKKLTPQEGVAVQYDFKDVFGSILSDWFGADSQTIASIFSHEFTYTPLVAACTSTPTTDLSPQNNIRLKPSPNPFFEQLDVTFNSSGQNYRLGLFNIHGQPVRIFEEKYFVAGAHQLSHQINDLPPGNYFYRLEGKNVQAAIPLIHF